MEKLTLEICMKYPNAKIFHKTEHIEYYDIEDWFRTKYYYKSFMHHIGDCQLVLRPIDSLTEEERKHLMDICVTKNYSWSGLQTEFELIHEGYEAGHLPVIIADYLRSINIDIDNLKKRGEVIKNDKL